MDAWSMILMDRKRFYCETCGCDFYERNKEKVHYIYVWGKGGRDVGVCGKLLTYNQKRKQLMDWDRKHPKDCRSCDGKGYNVIGGTESEVCHCRDKKAKKKDERRQG